MHCNTERFRELYEILQKSERQLPQKALDDLKELGDDLSGLLASPHKSESARQTLSKGLLTVDGAELKLSERFMYAAVQVADELDLDEMLAAKFTFYASESAKRLGIELPQAALLLFYFRRAHILNIVKVLVELQPTNFKLSTLIGNNPGLLMLKALEGVQKSIEDLQERLSRGKFLKLDSDPQFVTTVEAQREFLVSEHQMLSCILYALVQNKYITSANIVEILKQVTEFSTYNLHMYAYVLPLLAWFKQAEDCDPVYEFFTSAQHTWRLQWWKGGLALMFAVYYSGSSQTKHSYTDIMNLIRKSINEGGLEFLAAVTHDISGGINTTFNDFTPLLRTRVPLLNGKVSSVIVEFLVPQLEALVVGFIEYSAVILKEMRLSEEDAFLSLAADSVRPGVDLERFFLFAAYLYQGRPDAGLEFWHKPALYGFLNWGSSIQVAFISATFNEMLTALSCGPNAAFEACKMLRRPTSGGAVNLSKSQDFVLSWQYMYDVMKYYIAKLEQSNETLDDDTVIVLFSYLHLICQIVSDSPDALKLVWDLSGEAERSSNNLVQVMFEFLRFQSPLYAPIFACLAAIVSKDKTDDLWKFVDEWAFMANIYKNNGNGIYFPPSNEPRFDLLLTSVSDVCGFVELLAKLASATDSRKVPASQKLGFYCDFVVNEVFVWSKDQPDVAALQRSCMTLIGAFLRPLDGKLTQVPISLAQSLNMDRLVEGDQTTVSQFLELFPYDKVLDLCFTSNVYQVLFSIMSQKMDTLISLPHSHATISNIICAIELAQVLLRDHRKRFEEPALYNLAVIPNLAMYWSSKHIKLALASIGLVKEISQSPVLFNRILSLFETFDDNVKIGLVEQFARDEFVAGQFDAELYNFKIAALEMLVDGTAKPEINFTHYILGFGVGNGVLTMGSVGSGVSLLDNICLLLKRNVSSIDVQEISLNIAKLSYLQTRVLLNLVYSPLCSSLVLDFLRGEEDFLLELLKLEPIASTRTSWNGESGNSINSIESAETFYYFFNRRAALLEMVALEFHTSAKTRALSLISKYVKLLMNLQSNRSVLQFLDFIKFCPEAPAELPAGIQPLVSLDPKSELQTEKLRLALLVSPSNNAGEKSVVNLYRQNLIFVKLKSAQLACLQPWSQLVPVLVNDTRDVAKEADTIIFVLETIQTLVPKLVENSRRDLTFCKPLASLLVLLLERYQESHEPTDIIALDRLHSLYRAAVLCIPSSITFASLRTDLYVICYQTLQMTLLTKQQHLYKEKLDVVLAVGDRVLEAVCVDSLCQQEDLRLVALIFLQTLAAMSRELGSTYIGDTLIRSNLLQLLVQSTIAAPLVDTKVTLCLLLELAQNRKCANYLLQNSLVENMSQMRVLGYEVSQRKPEYDLYLIVFQLLTAIVLSTGQDNKQSIALVRSFLDRHYQLISMIIKADTEGHLQSGPLERCSNAITRLLSLSEYEKA